MKREKQTTSLNKLIIKVKESTTETKELKHIYGNWIKFPVSRNTEYEISTVLTLLLITPNKLSF